MREHYYGRDGRPISRVEAIELLGNRDARRVASDIVIVGDEPVLVSTVHLVIDHAWEGPPLIFETMTFTHDEPDDECWRYPSEAAALAGHDRVVAMLNDRAHRR